MPKQDRGAPARPPWLPEEDEQRGFLRSLRRKKRNADEEESLTREPERPSKPTTPAPESVAEKPATPVEKPADPAPWEEKSNGAKPVPDASKYYTPPRPSEELDEQPVAAKSAEVADEAPQIVASPLPEMKPEPRPIPQAEQPEPPNEPEPVVPEPVAYTPPPADPEPVVPEPVVQEPVAYTPPPADSEPVVPEPAVEPPVSSAPEQEPAPSAETDPFSRFSVLEAQLRQMSLDESITDAELERHRRHLMPDAEPEPASEPEAKAPAALSFTPPEAVETTPESTPDIPEVVAEEAPAPSLGFTLPEQATDTPVVEQDLPEEVEPEAVSVEAPPEPEAVEPEPEPVVPEAVEPEPSHTLTADFVLQAAAESDITGDFVPQTAAVEEPVAAEEPDEPAEPEAPVQEPTSSVDDIDARAAALLQRIEAKRAELNEELSAHDMQEPEAPAAPTPEPVRFEPMVAPWAAVPEPEPVQEAPVSDEPEALDEVQAETVDEPAEPEPTAAADPEPEPEEALPPQEALDETPPVVVDVAEPETPVEPEVPVAQAVDPLPAEPSAPEAPIEAPALEVPAEAEAGPAEPVEPAEVVEPELAPEDAADGEKPQRPPGRRLAPPPWQIPSAMQPAPAVEPPAQQAYYVPPQQPEQQAPPPQPMPHPEVPQHPAAQAPPGWNPQQPYPGQWPPQGAPQPPQPYGGQQLPPQPPQPTSVEGQWQWVPQQPQQPQPPQQQGPPPGQQQQPPAGYVPPPQTNAPPANYRAPQAYRMPPSLDEAEVINRGRYAPKAGWRKAVHRSTGGRVNPGDSRKDREKDQLLASIRQPILGDYRIAVLSIKGGVGKTTTTLGLGSAFATIRTDRIIAVDANPDRGTLAERVRDHSTQSTVRDLLNDRNIRSYADVRNHTRMATSRLEVLASEQDPAVSEAFGEVDYRNTIDILQRYYNIILTDCGTGIMHSAMSGVLDLAHTIVLVSSPAMDSARSASATLDWLMQHGHSGLVREAHVVLSASRPGSAGIKLDKVYEHFEARCRSIHMIPFDPHLAEGADVDFNLLNADTNEAYLKLAGAISESFPRLRMRGDEQR